MYNGFFEIGLAGEFFIDMQFVIVTCQLDKFANILPRDRVGECFFVAYINSSIFHSLLFFAE